MNIKLGDYVEAELNFKPANWGRQSMTISGTVTAITDEILTIDEEVLIVRAFSTITVFPNVISFG